MTVVLVDGVGREQVRDVPDHLQEFRVAICATPALRVRLWDAPVDVTIAVFRPSGEYRYGLSPTGVAACPIWRMVHAAG